MLLSSIDYWISKGIQKLIESKILDLRHFLLSNGAADIGVAAIGSDVGVVAQVFN